MSRPVTEKDFRRPEFMLADPEDYEFREDGKIVRKDRWQQGLLVIQAIVGPRGQAWEIDDVVDRVEKLKGCWTKIECPEDFPTAPVVDLRLECGSVLVGCRLSPEGYRWPASNLTFSEQDFGPVVVAWQVSKQGEP